MSRFANKSTTSWQQVVVMEFGKRDDTTDTTDFCLHQLVTEYGLATGKLVQWALAFTQQSDMARKSEGLLSVSVNAATTEG